MLPRPQQPVSATGFGTSRSGHVAGGNTLGGEPMKKNVSDHLVERLHAWGVRRIYGYPGDGINGIMGAFGRAQAADRVHPGAPRGDGRVHGVRARQVHRRGRRLHGDLRAGRDPPAQRPLRREARPPAGGGDRRPAGARRRSAATTSRRSICTSLFKDVAARVRRRWRSGPAQVRHLIDRAMRIALAERTVTCVIIPNDLQEADAVAEPPREHGTIHSGLGYAAPAGRSRTTHELARAAEILNAGEQGRDAGRRRARSHATRRGDRGRRAARRRRRQGAARQGRPARRPALRHRLDRPARHQAELDADEGAATRC